MPYALRYRGREYTVAERDRLVRGSGEKPFMVEGLGKCIAFRFFLINKVLSYLGPDA